ncbi:hypothetical protein LDENG_00280440, partial [Lucifuga dentata]
LFTGLPNKSIKQLQLIQNAAARLLTNTKKREHISPILKTLHLALASRIDFKALLIVYKSLNGLGPKCIADMFVNYMPGRSLRSAETGQLVVPRVRTKCGEMAFSHYVAHCWNQLPPDIRCSPTVTIFKTKLKTVLFSIAVN